MVGRGDRPFRFGSDANTILFYSVLGCVLPLHEVGSLRSPPSFSVLCYLCPRRSLLPSLQRRFGLPTDFTPFICLSVLLIVCLLSFSRAMCPVHFHFTWVTYVCLAFFAQHSSLHTVWRQPKRVWLFVFFVVFWFFVGWLLNVPATC